MELPAGIDPQAVESLNFSLRMHQEIGVPAINPLTPEEASRCNLLGARNILGVMHMKKRVAGRLTNQDAIVFMVVRKALQEEVDPKFLAENLVERFFRGYVSDVWAVGLVER